MPFNNRACPNARFAIIDAYLDSLEDIPYDRIQVKSLVERAGVARSTFYVHFDDALDVLECIQRDTIEKLSLYSTEESEVLPSPYECMATWFATCLQHRRTLRVLTGENGDPYFQRRLTSRLRCEFEQMMDDDDIPIDSYRPYIANALASLCVGLMERAVRDAADDTDPDPQKLASIVNFIRIAFHLSMPDAPAISDERLFGKDPALTERQNSSLM